MSGVLPYRDRAEAGRALAELLDRYRGRDDVIVLALPRGGVPVAREIAAELHAPLDVLLVRKLGAPGQEELALGAIASAGTHQATVLNEEIVSALGLSQDVIDALTDREREELRRRERLYRPGTAGASERSRHMRDAILIVVDDGLATGATMRAAVQALRQFKPAGIIVAVPVAPADTIQALRDDVDDVICPLTPTQFGGVGQWYEDFAQVTDEHVRQLLDEYHHATH